MATMPVSKYMKSTEVRPGDELHIQTEEGVQRTKVKEMYPMGSVERVMLETEAGPIQAPINANLYVTRQVKMD